MKSLGGFTKAYSRPGGIGLFNIIHYNLPAGVGHYITFLCPLFKKVSSFKNVKWNKHKRDKKQQRIFTFLFECSVTVRDQRERKILVFT